MIDYKELEAMDRWETAYLYTICKMRLYREKIDKITLFKKINDRNRVVSNVTVYLTDKTQNIHTLFFRLHDDGYIWYLNAITHDFPEAPFEDLTNDKEIKLNTEGETQHDVSASTET